VFAGRQPEVRDQSGCKSMQILMQQAQKTQAGGQRGGALDGLEDRDRPQRPAPRDGM
jgi:hypothetical protein